MHGSDFEYSLAFWASDRRLMEVVKSCAAMSAQALRTEFLLGHAMVPKSALLGTAGCDRRVLSPFLDAKRNVGVARDQSSRS